MQGLDRSMTVGVTLLNPLGSRVLKSSAGAPHSSVELSRSCLITSVTFQRCQILRGVCSLRAYAGQINDAAARLCGELAVAASEGKEVEMWRIYGAMTMEVVGGAAFGCHSVYLLCFSLTHLTGMYPCVHVSLIRFFKTHC